MGKIRVKLSLIVCVCMIALGIPGISHADNDVTVTVTPDTPVLSQSVLLKATGLVAGKSYQFAAQLPMLDMVILAPRVVADNKGVVAASVKWKPKCSVDDCEELWMALGLYRLNVLVCEADGGGCEEGDSLEQSSYVYPGLNNRMGTIKISGPGYANKRFVAGKKIHVEAKEVGNGPGLASASAAGMLGLYLAPTNTDSLDDFWDSVTDPATRELGVELLQGELVAGKYSGDVTVPTLPVGKQLQLQYYYILKTDSKSDPLRVGIAAMTQQQAGSGPRYPKPEIDLVLAHTDQCGPTWTKRWIEVHFTLPQQPGVWYDRVEYSLNGHESHRWQNYHSPQRIENRQPGTYRLRIKAHIAGYSWLPLSDFYTFKIGPRDGYRNIC